MNFRATFVREYEGGDSSFSLEKVSTPEGKRPAEEAAREALADADAYGWLDDLEIPVFFSPAIETLTITGTLRWVPYRDADGTGDVDVELDEFHVLRAIPFRDARRAIGRGLALLRASRRA